MTYRTFAWKSNPRKVKVYFFLAFLLRFFNNNAYFYARKQSLTERCIATKSKLGFREASWGIIRWIDLKSGISSERIGEVGVTASMSVRYICGFEYYAYGSDLDQDRDTRRYYGLCCETWCAAVSGDPARQMLDAVEIDKFHTYEAEGPCASPKRECEQIPFIHNIWCICTIDSCQSHHWWCERLVVPSAGMDVDPWYGVYEG